MATSILLSVSSLFNLAEPKDLASLTDLAPFTKYRREIDMRICGARKLYLIVLQLSDRDSE